MRMNKLKQQNDLFHKSGRSWNIPGNVVTSDKRTKVHEAWIRHIEILGNPFNVECCILKIAQLLNAIKGISSLHRAFRKITSTINQQMHLYNFHLKRFKTLKTTPTRFDLFRSSSGSFVIPC